MRRHRHVLVLLCLSSVALAGAHAADAGAIAARVTDAAGQPLADAVVYAMPRGAKPPAPTPPTERVVMDQRDQEFMPYVLPVRVGTPVYFPNSDDTRHHVYSFSPAKTFELPLYAGTPAAPVVFDKPGAVALGCNIHDWMVAYIYVVDTPWFGKTADDGAARLATLPAGEYEVRAWHPRLTGPADATAKRVRVEAATDARVEFRLALNPERRKPRPSDYNHGQYEYR
jgi:plastocyanin